MPFSNRNLFTVGIFLLAFQNAVANEATLVAEGWAYKAGTNTLLYTERHFIEDADKRRVVYYEPDGSEFAHKTLHYSLAESMPFFQQHNTRLGELIEVSAGDKGNIRVTYRPSPDAQSTRNEIDPNQNLVIDAGFDNFIQQHWEALNRGEKLTFDYLLPTRARTIELAIGKTDCDSPRLCLRISPANALLGLFADDIKLEYSRDTRKLYRFAGKSNIANSQGKYQTVSIVYEHFPENLHPQEQQPSS